MPTEDVAHMVASTYDRFGTSYEPWAEAVRPAFREGFVDKLTANLDRGHVLELGCGPGVPVGRLLVARYEYTGIDVSHEFIELARSNLPGASLIEADMTAIEFASDSFDAICAFHSIIHVPREEHSGLFGRIASWLRPEGWFVASLGARDTPGDIEERWLGKGPMFFSHFDADTNVEMLRDAGFLIHEAQVLAQYEGRHRVEFLWLLARREGTGTA